MFFFPWHICLKLLLRNCLGYYGKRNGVNKSCLLKVCSLYMQDLVIHQFSSRNCANTNGIKEKRAQKNQIPWVEIEEFSPHILGFPNLHYPASLQWNTSLLITSQDPWTVQSTIKSGCFIHWDECYAILFSSKSLSGWGALIMRSSWQSVFMKIRISHPKFLNNCATNIWPQNGNAESLF